MRPSRVSTSSSGSSHNKPREPLRTSTASRSARVDFRLYRGRNRVRAHRRARPHRREQKYANSWTFSDKRENFFFRRAAVQFAVDHHRRRKRTIAKTINFFQRETPVMRRLAQMNTERAFQPADQILATHALTGFRAANLDDMPSGGFAAKIVIEADHAMHFSAREIENLRNQPNGRVADIAEMLIQGVQDRQQRSFQSFASRSMMWRAASGSQSSWKFGVCLFSTKCSEKTRVRPPRNSPAAGRVVRPENSGKLCRSDSYLTIELKGSLKTRKESLRASAIRVKLEACAISTASSVGADTVTRAAIRAKTAFCTSS